MARAASALDLPLHANLAIMAQCRRRLLRQDQFRPQTLRVDRTPKPHPRRCQKREGKVRVDPLAVLSKAARNLVAHPPTDAAAPSCASKCPISMKTRWCPPKCTDFSRADH